MLSSANGIRGHLVSAFTLILCGTLICLYYGRLGFMPLDQSIVFDGAWRVLNGQVPGRDFNTPNGFTPILMQAVFFKLFGVSWFGLCVHAAVVNGLYACLVFLTLQLIGVRHWLAYCYGLLSAFIFYPPQGTPYLEQHAFFFSLIALYGALQAMIYGDGWRARCGWLTVPLALSLAMFSKQIPTLFMIPLIVAYGVVKMKWQSINTALLFLTLGTLGTVMIWAGAGWLSGISLANFEYYVIELPGKLGRIRLEELLREGHLLRELSRAIGLWSLRWSFVSTMVLTGLALAVLAVRSVMGWSRAGSLTPEVFLGAALASVSLCFTLLTSQQADSGAAFLLLGMAPAHESLVRWAARFSKRTIVRLIALALILVPLCDVYHFCVTTNQMRLIHFEADTPPGPYLPGASVSRALSFMQFDVPIYARHGFSNAEFAAALHDLLQFFANNKGNFLLIGDSSILYGLSRRPSVSASLWFHSALSVPPFYTRAFDCYDREMRRRLRKFAVRYVVLEGKQTWMGLKLQDFQLLNSAVQSRLAGQRTFGPFEVLILRNMHIDKNGTNER